MTAREDVYRAQISNIRELENAWAHINRQINALIQKGDIHGVEALTKVLAVVYCGLAEALFSKILHTPHGLSDDRIDQVKVVLNAEGVTAGWKKCAELGLELVDGGEGNYKPNVQQRLGRLIETYIRDPSIVRNKLAHGQWHIALNRENNKVNADITSEIASYDVVVLYRRKSALSKLAAILHDLIESPDRAHWRDYWMHLEALEDEQQRMSSWTFEKKRRQMFEKRSYTKRERN
jgi:hypothetical protein